MDIFICDRSIFCQFDLRTVEDAGPYNAWKDAFSFLRTYRHKNGLISIIVCYRQKKKRQSPFADIISVKRVPTDRENGLCELCLSVGTGVLDGPQIELTKYGPIADKYIHQLHDFYEDLSVESYVIMPNHINIMLRVDGEENGPSRTPVPTFFSISSGWKPRPSVNKPRGLAAGTARLRVKSSPFGE